MRNARAGRCDRCGTAVAREAGWWDQELRCERCYAPTLEESRRRAGKDRRVQLSLAADGKVEVRAVSYLAVDRAEFFRRAVQKTGAGWSTERKVYRCHLDAVPDLCEDLRARGFVPVLSPSLAATLQSKAAAAREQDAAADEATRALDAALAKRSLYLRGYQKVGIRWLAATAPGSGVILGDDMGCVDGDAVLQVSRAGKSGAMDLRTLHRRFNGAASRGRAWDPGIPTLVRSLLGGRFGLHRVEAVVSQGVRPTVRLVLESGKSVRLTPDHEVAIPGGAFVAVEELLSGDRVLTDEAGTKGGLACFVPKVDRVVRVEGAGETDVYDVVCADPHRNFVADGVVVHNCGKTATALLAVPEQGSLLVVCPAVAKGVWRNELDVWRKDMHCRLVEGRATEWHWPEAGEAVVLNYDLLLDDPPGVPLPGTVVVFDEGHVLKYRQPSKKPKRHERCKTVAEAVTTVGGRKWLLTGTPILNEPVELYAVMEVLGVAEACFGDFKNFRRLYGVTSNGLGGFRWSTRPDRAAVDLLQRYMLRRLKADVLADLPRVTVQTVPVEIDDETRATCDAVLERLAAAGISLDSLVEARQKADACSAGGGLAFELIAGARAALAKAKLPAALELVDQVQASGEPVLLYSCHRVAADALRGSPGWETITGDTSPARRTKVAEAFQAGNLAGVACTIQASGVALTLTRACYAVFLDEAWTPALNHQARSRLDRIGQTRPVTIYRLVADHPLDQRVAELNERKMALIEGAVDAAAVGRTSTIRWWCPECGRDRPSSMLLSDVISSLDALEDQSEGVVAMRDRALALCDWQSDEAALRRPACPTCVCLLQGEVRAPSGPVDVAGSIEALLAASQVAEAPAEASTVRRTARDGVEAAALEACRALADDGVARSLVTQHGRGGGLTDKQWEVVVRKGHSTAGAGP